MFALGAAHATDGSSDHFMEVGKGIANVCHESYQRTGQLVSLPRATDIVSLLGPSCIPRISTTFRKIIILQILMLSVLHINYITAYNMATCLRTFGILETELISCKLSTSDTTLPPELLEITCIFRNLTLHRFIMQTICEVTRIVEF